MNAYAIFGDKAKAIELCLARFDDETKESFMSLYEKIDADIERGDESSEEIYDNAAATAGGNEKCPF